MSKTATPVAPTSATTPLLVGRLAAAAMLAIAPRTLDRLRAAGKLPPALAIAGKVVWRVADLTDYVAAGCDIDRWRALQLNQ